MKDKDTSRIERMLSCVMLYGVCAAAALLLIGGIINDMQHGGSPVKGHHFHGEPLNLRNPIDVLKAAFAGNVDSLIQAGVLLLLLIPLVRTALAAVGFYVARDRLYVWISLFVLAVLVLSLFL